MRASVHKRRRGCVRVEEVDARVAAAHPVAKQTHPKTEVAQCKWLLPEQPLPATAGEQAAAFLQDNVRPVAGWRLGEFAGAFDPKGCTGACLRRRINT